jgi:Ca2+-binding EF-hand superfamily protein
MKTKTSLKLVLLAVALTGGAIGTFAQPADGDRPDGPPPRGPGGPGRPGGPNGPRRGAPPFIVALDTNKDGKIDAAELANASQALLTLDKNKDGQLTPDELHPTPPEGAPERPERTNADRPEFVPPLLAALDTDKDGTLSASEIANATAALKTLDKNGDGVLTRDEYMGMPRGGFGGRGRGPGGPGGNGFGPGPGQPPPPRD